jgi:ABC-type transporter Mla subunit MlaD
MNSSQIRSSASLRRSQRFLDENSVVVGEVNTTKARHQLDAAVATLDATAAEQGTRTREARAVVVGRKQLENTLIRTYMTPLSKFARAKLQGVPDYAALTPSANDLRTEKLVQSARAMANAADPLTAQLAEETRFPATFLADLRKAADAVRASIDTRSQKTGSRAGATKQIASALASGRNAVAQLDASVSFHILRNDRLEREWLAAKRVTQSTAPVTAQVPTALPPAVPVVPAAHVTSATPVAPVTPLTLMAPSAQEVPATKVA